MPEFNMPIGDTRRNAFDDLDAFTQGYVEAMFFTECNSDNPELEHKAFDDLAGSTMDAIGDDCRAFQELNAQPLLLAYARGFTETEAGRDFWYSRNGHGTGFWDSDLDELGTKLDEACKRYRAVDIYAGDDGKVYLS